MAHSIRPLKASVHIDALAFTKAILLGDIDAAHAILTVYGDDDENPVELIESLVQCFIGAVANIVGPGKADIAAYLDELDHAVRQEVRK
jgi:hypothetical protein